MRSAQPASQPASQLTRRRVDCPDPAWCCPPMRLTFAAACLVVAASAGCKYDEPKCSDIDPPRWCANIDGGGDTDDPDGKPDPDAAPDAPPDAAAGPVCPVFVPEVRKPYQRCEQVPSPNVQGCFSCKYWAVPVNDLPSPPRVVDGQCCQLYGCVNAVEGAWPACE